MNHIINRMDEQKEKRQAAGIISLRPRENVLFEFLSRNKNKVTSRVDLLEYVWNYDKATKTNTLDSHMTNLRRKMESAGYPQTIQTIHGQGYKLCDIE